jgi:hypothetical protein
VSNDEVAPAPAAKFDRGPLQTYEITWQNGHIERVLAHQVSYPNNHRSLFGREEDVAQIIEFHGEVNGRWLLQLRVHADDIRTVRNLTTTESEVI